MFLRWPWMIARDMDDLQNRSPRAEARHKHANFLVFFVTGGELLTSMLGYELLDARGMRFPDFLFAGLA
jgi:hypothetical protein